MFWCWCCGWWWWWGCGGGLWVLCWGVAVRGCGVVCFLCCWFWCCWFVGVFFVCVFVFCVVVLFVVGGVVVVFWVDCFCAFFVVVAPFIVQAREHFGLDLGLFVSLVVLDDHVTD
ncbi:hypothetical protein, partial [Pseudomonas syringae group genomosp. 7]|uniref:hypothetical protein n=1 Tax=Pseudomonas syringae group genomosp. 7 TaxID=251699 RepID=UPI0037705A82